MTRRAAAWLVVAAAAVLHTWPYRYRLVNLDCVSYLDIADAWLSSPWREAVNGYWSPMYSWVLAAALQVTHARPPHEYLLVHAVNIVLFLVAFGAWRLLLAELRLRAADRGATFSPIQFEAISVLLFLWIGLTQLVVWMESPDLIVTACVLVASAMVLRLERGGGYGDAVALGCALGVGYLTKAAMLPLAVVYLVCAFFTRGNGDTHRFRELSAKSVSVPVSAGPRFPLRRTLTATLVFLLLAGPWVAALSIVKGRFTTGDVGRLNYLWFVTRSEEWPKNWPVHWPHWDGVEGRGTLIHPARRLHDDPVVYEFATPFAATYPMWYDASYWHDGVSPQLDVRDQLRRLKLSAGDLFRLTTLNFYNRELWNPQPALIGLVAVLWLTTRRRVRWPVAWPIVVPALAAFGLYALVYIEPRYLGAAMLVIWAAILAAVRADDSQPERRLLDAAGGVAAAVLAVAVSAAIFYDGVNGWRRMLRGEADEINQPWHVASFLRDAGLVPGTRVGIIGNAQVASRWARLGRVRIIAEVPIADAWKFGSADATKAQAVVDAFARAGVAAVLSEYAPPPAARAGWVEVSGTPYWLLPLSATAGNGVAK